MKKRILITSLVFCSFAVISQAQILKKLKEKVQKVEKSVTGDASGNSTSSTNTESSNKLDSKFVADNCQKIYTMATGEKFSYEEFGPVKDRTESLVITTKNGFRTLENGKVSEPTQNLSTQQIANSKKTNNISGSAESNTVAANPYEYVKSGHIVFNGKSYGPYLMVVSIQPTNDKSNFYACVGVSENKEVAYYLVDGTGRKVKLPTIGMGMAVSNDGKMACIMVSGATLNAIKDKTKNNANEFMTNTGATAYMITGKQVSITSYGDPQWISNNGILYSIPSVEKVSQLFADGKLAVTFPENVVSKTMFNRVTKENIVVGNDPSKAILLLNSGFGFPDGTIIDTSYNTFQPKKATIDGKEYITWYYMDGKDIYFCKKQI